MTYVKSTVGALNANRWIDAKWPMSAIDAWQVSKVLLNPARQVYVNSVLGHSQHSLTHVSICGYVSNI